MSIQAQLPDTGIDGFRISTDSAHPSLQGLRRFNLSTRDAHGLYERFGFKPLANPQTQMEIVKPDIYQQVKE